MTLCSQIIYLIRLDLGNDANQAGRVRHIAPMEIHKTLLFHVADPFVKVQVLDAPRIERGTAAKDAMDFVAFLDEEFGEEGAVLTGDTGD